MGAFRKRDLIFLGIVFLIVFIIFIIPRILPDQEDIDHIELSVDGKIEIYEIRDQDQEIVCERTDRGSYFMNTFVIGADGRVFMKAANCPDGTCMRQGIISRNNETIVCLPHKLIIRVICTRQGDDIIVR